MVKVKPISIKSLQAQLTSTSDPKTKEWMEAYFSSEGLRYAIEKFPPSLQTELKEYRQRQLKALNSDLDLKGG